MVNLKSLPIEIYKKIPISIRTYKDEYEISELPYDIQHLVEQHILPERNIYVTKTIYDFDLFISEYGDLKTIENLVDLIIKYIQNYFDTMKGDYPFNGVIGSKIKKLLQKKDTVIQNMYMSEELNNMIRTFTNNNSDYDISLVNFKLSVS